MCWFVYPTILIFYDNWAAELSFRVRDGVFNKMRAQWIANIYWEKEQNPEQKHRALIQLVQTVVQLTADSLDICDYPGSFITFEFLKDAPTESQSSEVLVATLEFFQHHDNGKGHDALFHYRSYLVTENEFEQCPTIGGQIGSILYQH